uniref:Uncharacterized protein n=1 Tax=Meloidogyne floridensis TaxID=298350 RepID=A0A915P182_9BILA
ENISIRQSCQTNHLGIEKCIGCCSVDFCNYLLPNELFIRNNLNKNNLNEGKLDNEELPECIDKQLIEIKCETFLNVRKIGNGLTEPILIVWPQITDNDPYFNIRPLNIPLVHPNIPIPLPDNLTEIQWEAVDRHGIVIKCFTKLKFLEEEIKNNNLESPSITISIELLPIWSTTLNNKNINCIKNLVKSIRPSLLNLIGQKCPNINWGSQSQFYNLIKITQNFTTGIEK